MLSVNVFHLNNFSHKSRMQENEGNFSSEIEDILHNENWKMQLSASLSTSYWFAISDYCEGNFVPEPEVP